MTAGMTDMAPGYDVVLTSTKEANDGLLLKALQALQACQDALVFFFFKKIKFKILFNILKFYFYF